MLIAYIAISIDVLPTFKTCLYVDVPKKSNYLQRPTLSVTGLAIVCNFLGTDFLLSRNDNGFNELGSSVAVIRLQALHGLLGMSFASTALVVMDKLLELPQIDVVYS